MNLAVAQVIVMKMQDLVYKQIGNAVPVRLALAVAEPIAEFAKKELQGK